MTTRRTYERFESVFFTTLGQLVLLVAAVGLLVKLAKWVAL